MPILGAHMSIAGGLHKAVMRAAAATCECVQIFTKSNHRWSATPISEEAVKDFRDALKMQGISHVLVHGAYLINLASPDDGLWRKSLEALIVEMQRIAQLGIPNLVLHPGAFVDSDERTGLSRIAEALQEMIQRTPSDATRCLLETTAGQGTNLGWKFEHLAQLLNEVGSPQRFGVCLDTCHMFAAGYDLRTESTYRATMAELETTLGIEKVHAIHLNDSQRDLGERIDRHEHIGKGCLGLDAFRFLLNDSRFAQIPMYLETPKDRKNTHGDALDKMNLETLRSLIIV